MSDAIHDLAELLSRLPGIGKRTALRLTFHLLKSPNEYLKHLGEAVASIRDVVKPCSRCRNLSEQDPCAICEDPRRDSAQICVVANVQDLWAIEESGAYRGRYHVLHGLFAPLDGIGPEDLKVDLLRERVVKERTEEVIIATRPSVEGEATALLVHQTLEGMNVKITRIASGISYGSELEYADRMTLGKALSGRREMQ
jgi:recombination protein RecR